MRALRAQISPHFVYNSLTAIASFVRTDPERARELLLEFADFTRYSFRRARRVHHPGRGAAQHRALPRCWSRPGSATGCRSRCRSRRRCCRSRCRSSAVQPLVENAVRHGLEGKAGVGHVTIVAARPRARGARSRSRTTASACDPDAGPPDRWPASPRPTASGLGNVDARLRQVFGDDVRPGRGDRPGRGHEGELPGAEVRTRRDRSPRPVTARPTDPRAWTHAPAGRTGLARARVVDDEAPALRGAGLPARPGPADRRGPHRRQRRRGAAGPATTDAVDVVFCDIRMPGLDGLDLARVLARFASRPQVVFVTAYDEHAVEAFDLRATDYVMKPVRAERLAEAVRRVVDAPAGAGAPAGRGAEDETIPVELGGVTRFVQRSQVRYVEAHGRLRPAAHRDGTHLVRIPLTTLEERWAEAGFVRIHRSTLVAAARTSTRCASIGGRCTVRLGDGRAAGEPPAHPRAARHARAPATGPVPRRRARRDRPEPGHRRGGCASRRRGAMPRRAAGAARPVAPRDRRADRGRRGLPARR